MNPSRAVAGTDSKPSKLSETFSQTAGLLDLAMTLLFCTKKFQSTHKIGMLSSETKK